MPDQQKIIVLDRDGVINFDSADYIKGPEEWQPIPGSLEAIAQLHQAGYLVMVATNQSGLGRGLFDEFALARIHETLIAAVEEAGGVVSGIFFCPHRPEEQCHCRKPATGLLEQIEVQFKQPLRGSWLIGDSLKDLQLARAFAMQPMLVRTGNGKATEAGLYQSGLGEVPVWDDLQTAVNNQVLAARG